MNSINISIIIPNYNGAKYLPSCLNSIKTAISLCPGSQFEIILVDNNSTDNSLEIPNQFFTKNKIILNSKNFGFAKAVNQGINASQFEYVCLFNNDLILESDWFVRIIPHINQNIACYCGTVMNLNGSKIESQGISFNFNGSCDQNNHNQIFLPNKPAFPVWGSTAAAVMYQKSIIKKIGLFDESFFAYIEDVDLSFRLFKNHFYSRCIPSAITYHSGGMTSKKLGNIRQYFTLRNWCKLIIKNYSTTQFISYLPQIIVERLRNFSYLLKSIIKWS